MGKPITGCSGCATTAGHSACPSHGWAIHHPNPDYTDRLDALWSERLAAADRQIAELREALDSICDLAPVDGKACWCWYRPIDMADHMHSKACQRIRTLMGYAK
jgi:hypothetical protein